MSIEVLALIIFFAVGGFAIGYVYCEFSWKDRLAKRGLARYFPPRGTFEWTEPGQGGYMDMPTAEDDERAANEAQSAREARRRRPGNEG